MNRLPSFFRPFFPHLFALTGRTEAIAMVRKLIDDPFPMVRVGAISSIAHSQRDDFLSILRVRATHSNIAEQDAAAFALGTLKDSSSRDLLKRLYISRTDNVRIAAYKALYSLGDGWAKDLIEEMAIEKNLYAIAALGEIPGGEGTLVNLLYSKTFKLE